MLTLVRIVSLVFALIAVTGAAMAQPYPTKPIRVIIHEFQARKLVFNQYQQFQTIKPVGPQIVSKAGFIGDTPDIDAEFPADTFFPPWDRRRFALTAREPHETGDGLRYAFATYKRLREGD